jgi:hypothetical protein
MQNHKKNQAKHNTVAQPGPGIEIVVRSLHVTDFDRLTESVAVAAVNEGDDVE